jgi:hypothetical protein
LPDGRGWLLRPCLAGLVDYRAYLDGTIGLEDIALLNDALAADAENKRRAREKN